MQEKHSLVLAAVSTADYMGFFPSGTGTELEKTDVGFIQELTSHYNGKS